MKTLRRSMLVLLVAGSLSAWFWLRWLEHAYDPPYSLVEEGLYLGRAVTIPPPGTKAIVNVCGQQDRYQAETSLWSPILEGGEEPSLDWLRQTVKFIEVQRSAGRPTYVHCLAGMNRSGAVVTAYLMSKHNWGRDEALEFLQRKRAVVQPNPTLMRLLAQWETHLKEKSRE